MKWIRTAMVVSFGAMTAMAWSATPAHAQDDPCAAAPKPKKRGGLGGLLSSARSSGLEGSIAGAIRGDGNLRSDLTGVARGAAERTLAGAGTSAGCNSEPRDAAQPAEATPLPADTPRAAPPETSTARARREMAANDARYPSRMDIPAEWRTAKAVYDEFGKVKCFGCEGGYAYSGWPEWPRDEFSGKYGGAETRLSKLAIGHVHRWSANGFAGTLTVNGEEQVNGFRCRRMTYRLEKDGKSAERPSLICWGKSNEYAGSDSWVGVF